MSKVLVLSQHAGPLDRRIVAEMNSLADSGRQVTLVSVPTVIAEGCLDARVRVCMPSLQTYTPRGKTWLKRVAACLPGPLESLARTLLHRLRTGATPVLNRHLIALTPAEAFDVIHCHDLDTLPTAVEIQKTLLPKARLIYDSHEFFPYQFPTGDKRQKYWSHLEETHIRQADLVITVNESIARALASVYDIVPPAVLYNSYGLHSSLPPLADDAFLAHFQAPSGGFRVLFQGGFIREKNLEHLVQAFQYLDTSIQLFLLGDGPLTARLKTLVRRAGLRQVFFGAWVSQAELLRYVACADMGIIPYAGHEIVNNLYCTPNKLFEFIEAEIPICANDLPELRRIIVEHGIGDVYAMPDPPALARALDDCRQRCLGGAFTLARRREAKDRFSWARQGARLVELYAGLGV